MPTPVVKKAITMMNNAFTKEEIRAFYFGVLTILVFGVLFVLMAFSQHKYRHIDDEFYHLNAVFGRTDGLVVGDKVRMAGVDVGRVVGAHLDEHFNAVLKLEIIDGLKIPDDSSASIVSNSIMGSKYIEIEPGGSEEFLSDGDEFNYTQDAMVLQELLDRIVAIGKSKQTKKQTMDDKELQDE